MVLADTVVGVDAVAEADTLLLGADTVVVADSTVDDALFGAEDAVEEAAESDMLETAAVNVSRFAIVDFAAILFDFRGVSS